MIAPALQALFQSFGNLFQSRFFRSGLGSAAIRIAGLALSLGLSVFLARVMGAEGLGLYSLAFAAISLLGLPVQMGMPSLILRETARANATEDWPLLRGLWGWITRRILGLSFVIILTAALAVTLWPGLITPAARPAFLIGLPLVPVIALATARSSALQGLGKTMPSQIPEAILRPIFLIALAGVAHLSAGRTLSAGTMISLHLIAALGAFCVGAVLLLRMRPVASRQVRERRTESSAWRAAIWPLALIASAQSVMANADFLMLGWWRDAAEVGQYKVATSGGSLCALGLGVVVLMINPRIAALHRTSETSKMSRLAAQGAGAAFMLALPIFLIFIFWAGPILGLIYGTSYEPAAQTLVLLAAAQTVNAFFGSCVGLLNMTGHEKKAMNGFFLSTIMNVALNALLIPTMGPEGAALATLCSTAVWNFLLWRAAKRLLGVDSSVMGLLRTRAV